MNNSLSMLYFGFNRLSINVTEFEILLVTTLIRTLIRSSFLKWSGSVWTTSRGHQLGTTSFLNREMFCLLGANIRIHNLAISLHTP